MNTILEPAAHPSNLVTLDSMPSLGTLYIKAVTPNPKSVLKSISKKLPGGSQPTVDPLEYSLEDITFHVPQVIADPQHLESYQQLVGEPVDEYFPAGFVHVLAFPAAMAVMVRPGFPLPVAGMIHLANRVSQSRAIHREEELEVFAWAQNLTGHSRGTSVELVVEVRSKGQPVWRGVSTYLAKGKYLKGRGVESDLTETPRAEFVPPVPTAQWQLTPRTAKQYAAVSGDRNPIHTSILGAKAFGFAKPIAHGMFTAAKALAQSRALRPAAFEWTVEFGSPVLLPGRVAVALVPRATAAGPNSTDDPSSDAGSGKSAAGSQYVAWNAKSGKRFFTGGVLPL